MFRKLGRIFAAAAVICACGAFVRSENAWEHSLNAFAEGEAGSETGIIVTPPEEVKGVEAAGYSDHIKLSWKEVTGAEGYEVYICGSDGNEAFAGETAETGFTVPDLSAGVYYFGVKAYVLDEETRVYGEISDNVRADVLPEAVTGLEAAGYSDHIKLSWQEVTGAEGYEVYICGSDGNEAFAGETDSAAFTAAELQAGVYEFAVRAFVSDGEEKVYGELSETVKAAVVPAMSGGVSQTAQTASAVKITWQELSGADGYAVYKYDTDTKKYALVRYTSANYAVISGLPSASTALFKIYPYVSDGESKYTGGSFLSFKAVTTPKGLTGLKQSAMTCTTLTISWNRAEGADGYAIYLYDTAKNKYVHKWTVTGTSKTFTSLPNGRTYKFRVVPFKTVGSKRYHGAYADVTGYTLTGKPASLKVSGRTASGYTISWAKTTGASGYDIFKYDADKKKYVLFKANVTSTSLKVTGLPSGHTAFYKVRAYRTIGSAKRVGAVSDTIRAVTQVKAPAVRAESFFKGVNLTWGRVANASGYRIYQADTKNGTYKLIRTLGSPTSLKFTLNNISGGKPCYFKVAAYKRTGGANYEGAPTYITATPFNDNLNAVLTKYTGSKSIKVVNSSFKVSDNRKKKIMSLINNYGNTCGFVMLDIKSGTMVAYNADWYVPTASTAKGPFLAYVFSQELDKGRASLDEILTYQRKHYHSGSGVIQYAAYGTKYKLKTVIHNILEYSDNIGYYMLQDRFGVDRYNAWMQSLGCRTFINGTTMRWGYVSARDSAKVWVEIYRYLYTGKYKDFFKSELLDTGYSPIRNVLGSKYKVANKFGGADIGWHDTGIVFAGNDPYIMILLTNDSYLHPDYAFQRNMIKQLDALHDEVVKYNGK